MKKTDHGMWAMGTDAVFSTSSEVGEHIFTATVYKNSKTVIAGWFPKSLAECLLNSGLVERQETGLFHFEAVVTDADAAIGVLRLNGCKVIVL